MKIARTLALAFVGHLATALIGCGGSNEVEEDVIQESQALYEFSGDFNDYGSWDNWSLWDYFDNQGYLVEEYGGWETPAPPPTPDPTPYAYFDCWVGNGYVQYFSCVGHVDACTSAQQRCWANAGR